MGDVATTPRTENDAFAETVKDLLGHEVLELDHPEDPEKKIPIVVLPKGRETWDLKEFVDQYRTHPERRQGVADLGDLESFIAHAKRFADKDSALFATPKPARLVSVLDYHAAGADGRPRFGKHRGQYSFPFSQEWLAWVGQNKKAMSQTDFAEFVEQHLIDVIDPGTAGGTAKVLSEKIGLTFASPPKLLELSRGLTIREGVRVKNAMNLASGEAQVFFQSEHADEQGAPLKVPGAFLLAIPVFKNDAIYQLAVRLRYRLAGGALTWFYELYREDRLFDDAFELACKKAADDTGLPLFVGTPEP